MYTDPLRQYHDYLAATAASGYPNAVMHNPHPFEMSMFARQPYVPPFRYNMGRDMKLKQLKRSPFRPVRHTSRIGIKGM